MQNIALIGYSGHAFVVYEAANEMGLSVKTYCDKDVAKLNPYHLDYVGNEASLDFDWSKYDAFILGIGDNRIRAKVASLIAAKQKTLLNVIHPTAVVSKTGVLGKGIFISANATINALTRIGNNCIINTGSIIEHECQIGDNSHIAPGCVLAGNVHIGEQCFIGANAVIKQGVRVGNNVIIGAGSVVLNDIPDNEIWVGNPAKILTR